MRLIRLEVQGYRRFAEPQSINLDGRVIGIVGPNEAGKSSLLSAMTRLNDQSPIDATDWSRHRGIPEDWVVRARFLIDDSDREALCHVPGISGVRWYVVFKKPDGGLVHFFEPRDQLERQKDLRRRAADHLARAAKHRVFQDPEDPEVQVPIALTLSAASGVLDTNDETIDAEEALTQVSEAAAQLRAYPLPQNAPAYVRELPALVDKALAREQEPHPKNQALDHFDKRHPRFLVLGPEDRDLHSDYDLNAHADAPPRALSNLSELADLDLRALRDAIVGGNYARAEKLLEDANDVLKATFKEAWKQSGVYVRLKTDETVLRVFISAVDGYTSIAERSDGLRAFIALLTFTALYAGDRGVVLLVDEAENHLHYDAQADTVRVFSQQNAAEKVVYTTHSAGCLPHDLGAVRLVDSAEDGTSSIKNAFWADGPGLSPLLIGMGASVLAFTPTRRAVFVEGGADLVLVPALFREAAYLDDLEFQVVPGLSEVNPEEVAGLDLEAAAVAYLVDGDDAGRGIRSKLAAAGVPQHKIVVVGGDSSGLVVEDLVDADVYRDAIAAMLERSHGTGVATPSIADLGDTNRPGALTAWAKSNRLDPPNKAALAYEVLALHTEGRPLLSTTRAVATRETYAALAGILKVGLEIGASG